MLLAFLISPLVTPLTFIASATLDGSFRGDRFLFFFCFVALYAYAATLVFGLPVFLLYRAAGWQGVGAFALGGGSIGFFVGMLLRTTPAGASECTLAGGLSALTFRLLLAGYYRGGGEKFE